MKLLLCCLLMISCEKIKNIINNAEVEDSYPISPPYQLTNRQGKFNSISWEYAVKIPNGNQKDKTKKIKNEACDIFSVALDYISQKYPIKDINTDNKIIITENFKTQDDKQSRITIFAKSLDTLKIISNLDKKIIDQIKDDIINECN